VIGTVSQASSRVIFIAGDSSISGLKKQRHFSRKGAEAQRKTEKSGNYYT
jgi:hypothetical protein